MRKFLLIALCFAMLLGLAACSKASQEPHQSTEAVYYDELPLFREQNNKIFVSHDKEESWQLLSAISDALVGPGQNDNADTLAFKVKNDALYVSFDEEVSWELLGSVKGVSGEKTVTPQFKAEKAVLYVSLDNSASWAELAKLQCNHNYESEKDSGINVLNDITVKHTCTICGHSYTETIPATKELKVLALGNSFTVDAMEHLDGLLKNAGVKKFAVGNLYISGCSLEGHWTNIWENNADYSFSLKSETGTQRKTNITVDDALELCEWDIVVLQQAPTESADAATFGDLQGIIDHMKEKAPQAEIWWHMTWSCLGGSSWLENLGMTQMEMYENIASVVNSTILTNPDIAGVIPVGTTIQNLRTSKLGDTLNRDGLHLNAGIGRYTAAMTWLATLTGADIDKIIWTPSKYSEIADDLPLVKEAVKNAMQTPYAVTQSAHPAESAD